MASEFIKSFNISPCLLADPDHISWACMSFAVLILLVKMHRLPLACRPLSSVAQLRGMCTRCCVRGCQSDQFSAPLSILNAPKQWKSNFFALRAHFNTVIWKTIWSWKFIAIMWKLVIFCTNFPRSARNYVMNRMRGVIIYPGHRAPQTSSCAHI